MNTEELQGELDKQIAKKESYRDKLCEAIGFIKRSGLDVDFKKYKEEGKTKD